MRKLTLQKAWKKHDDDDRGAGRPLIMKSFALGCRKEDIEMDNGSFDGLMSRFGCAGLAGGPVNIEQSVLRTLRTYFRRGVASKVEPHKLSFNRFSSTDLINQLYELIYSFIRFILIARGRTRQAGVFNTKYEIDRNAAQC